MKDVLQELCLHLRAGYPLVFILSQEEGRAFQLIKDAAGEVGKKPLWPRQRGSVAAIDEWMGSDTHADSILVLDDIHRRLSDPDTLRRLEDLATGVKGGPFSVVVVAPWLELPLELERRCAVIDLPLPNPKLIGEALDKVCVDQSVIYGDDERNRLIRAAQGLTEDEAHRAFIKAALGWPGDGGGALTSVIADKRRSLRRSRVLESVDTPMSLDDVGGLDRLKDWLHSRKNAFSDEARKFGLPAPRGLLLMGIQGCGKSLTAKAVAGFWRLPLVRLDLSSVFGAERPEEALTSALRVSEAMAPMVLWIDEIEKGFDQGGTGPAARLLGGMVTWLQEKKDEVFVVATANRVENIPPELPRKGRFDEIFFVDLPNFHERCDILSLHLQKRGRDPRQFAIEGLAKKADKITGSELEQLVISAMYSAFSRELELTDSDLRRALSETVPLYDTFEEEIKGLREWAAKRARPASTDRRKIDLFSKNG